MQTALVIEDNEMMAQALIGYLQKAFTGMAVSHCGSLAEARVSLADRQPNIVLLDLGLPDGNGTQLFVENYLNKVAWVIVVTIFDDEEHLFSALRAGASGYLLKDETDQRFIEALQGIVAGRPPLSPVIARAMMQHFRPKPLSSSLSPRELELLQLIAEGCSVRLAAEQMGLATNTAAGYLKAIYQKLQVNSRAEVTRKAVELGLVRSTPP
ncbi:response regulator transcription factor [Gilvimarinus sp. SDUM040013]|uniref:Response regulator transcription factor n=1 Tax=Gilvimarinus gilvus TaxID=3058038 RepID=A0ABU4S2Y7_9GAMM|nr:response regulator transcription factor [Gilvimarinus sp. SDUM040013]MDO3387524.1 response regulator transcription factor [Gilvimarinus sp. SDUM040013]MDX6851488.1 response regulator transcription factor [Gilvimarinus sp. SDUM040013]